MEESDWYKLSQKVNNAERVNMGKAPYRQSWWSQADVKMLGVSIDWYFPSKEMFLVSVKDFCKWHGKETFADIEAWHLTEVGDILVTARLESTESGLISIDHKKAFDSVEHSYLWQTLNKLGFNSSFVWKVRTVYALKMNGTLSAPL